MPKNILFKNMQFILLKNQERRLHLLISLSSDWFKGLFCIFFISLKFCFINSAAMSIQIGTQKTEQNGFL